jgi:hypothetical protein
MTTIANVVALIIVGMLLLSFLLLWVVEMLDRVNALREYAPWLVTFAEHKRWHAVVLLVCWIFLCFDGVELYFKEIPAVAEAPAVNFVSPPPPKLTITELAPPIKAQCWIRNYAAPALPAPKWGIATAFCNTTITPPYSIEFNYDQEVRVGPFTFPVGSEFAKSTLHNDGTKIVGIFDLHTIIPNEPFSIMAQGSDDKIPLVKTAVIRAKGLVFEFHP